MREPTTAELLTRLRAGEPQAAAELADAFGVRIYQLAFRCLRNKEDAEEVMQDVLVKVCRKVGEFRGEAALSSWILQDYLQCGDVQASDREAPA